MKVRVAVLGTVGKSVLIDPDAGAQIGRNLRGPDGNVLTVEELKALLGSNSGSTIRHSTLQGLQQGNDHPQYPIKLGRESIKGQWNFTLPVWAADGSAALPAYSFAEQTNKGIYSSGANAMGFATAGTLQVEIDAAGLRIPTDNDELRIGAGNDLRLFHDGTNSFIRNDTGELRLHAGATLAASYTAAGTWAFPTAGTVSGLWKFTNATTGLEIESNSPRILIDDLNAAVSNERLWDIITEDSGGSAHLRWRTRTDADGPGVTFFDVVRNGSAIAQMQFGTTGGIFNVQGGTLNFTSTGAITATYAASGSIDFYLQGNGPLLTFSVTDASVNLSDYFPNAPAVPGAIIATGGDPIVFSIGFATAELVFTSSNVQLPLDNYELQIGAGQDLRLFHNGTNSIIENNTGNLILRVGGELVLEEVTTSTGANVPAIGANKPGSAVALTPSTWLTLPVNGTTYYIPLWT